MSIVKNLLQIKGNPSIWAVKPEDTVYDAIKLMAGKDVGALVVMAGDKLIGIVSERDCARKITLLGKSPKDTPVKDIMSTSVFIIHPSQTVEEAMELLNTNHIRHLPVVDEDDQVIGVISISDVLRDIIYRQREKIKRISEESK